MPPGIVSSPVEETSLERRLRVGLLGCVFVGLIVILLLSVVVGVLIYQDSDRIGLISLLGVLVSLLVPPCTGIAVSLLNAHVSRSLKQTEQDAAKLRLVSESLSRVLGRLHEVQDRLLSAYDHELTMQDLNTSDRDKLRAASEVFVGVRLSLVEVDLSLVQAHMTPEAFLSINGPISNIYRYGSDLGRGQGWNVRTTQIKDWVGEACKAIVGVISGEGAQRR